MVKIKMDADTRNFRKWLRKADTGIAQELKQCVARNTEACYNMAKERCPVDTGRLRQSIYFELLLGGTVGKVATNVYYARYVEQGTVYQPPKRFMQATYDVYKVLFVADVKNILDRYLNERRY